MELTSNQKKIFQAIFDHFNKTGQWPFIRLFEVEFRHLGNVRQIIKSIGNDIVILDNDYNKDSKVRLSLKAIALCKDSEQLLDDFAKVVKIFASKYIEHPLQPEISLSDLSNKDGLSDSQLQRISTLIMEASGLWRSAGGTDSNQVFEISPSAIIFENIESFSDYIKLVEDKSQVSDSNSISTALLHSSDALRRFQLDHPQPRKTAFVMMQFQNTKLHSRIFQALKVTLGKHNIVALRADVKSYHDELWSNIETYMLGCGLGLAVLERLSQDDFNPNISLEIGYMLALGKPVCLLKDATIKQIQSDLVGRLYLNFDTQDPENSIPQVLEKWLKDKGFIK